MSIRAKVRVVSITDNVTPAGSVHGSNVRLVPVMDGSPENKTWAKYTPSGHIELFIDNPAAVSEFREAHEFYVDFTPVAPVPKA